MTNKHVFGCTEITVVPSKCFDYMVRMSNKGRVKDEEKEFTVKTHVDRSDIQGLIDFLKDQITESAYCDKCGSPMGQRCRPMP